MNLHQLSAQKDALAVLLQGFAIAFLLHLSGSLQQRVEGSELLNQLDRTFVSNAGRAGDVIHGVSAQGHQVHNLIGTHAHQLLDLGGVADEVVLGRVEDADVTVDQLQHILVTADDPGGVTGVGGLNGQGTDEVVGLEALQSDDGNAIGLQGAEDVRHLLAKVLGHFGAIGLIAGVFHVRHLAGLAVHLFQGGHGRALLLAEAGAHVEDGGNVFGMEVLAQLVEHVHEDEDGRRGQARTGAHGALAAHGVVGAEDEGIGVYQKDASMAHGGQLHRAGVRGGGVFGGSGFFLGRHRANASKSHWPLLCPASAAATKYLYVSNKSRRSGFPCSTEYAAWAI